MEKLKYLSHSMVENLRESILPNLDRYLNKDFRGLMNEGEWSIELDLEVDLSPLLKLVPARSPESEIENSLLVWEALRDLTPALACEEGIWVRLTHVECLEYSRQRWLTAADVGQVQGMILSHLFANTLNRRRDDNALSRLWWNAYIANQTMPNDIESALRVFLKRADMRANIIERSLTTSRPVIAAAIVRLGNTASWIVDTEDNFRTFMRTLNKTGGGVVFEAMTNREMDTFMLSCATRAGMPSPLGATPCGA